MEAIILGNPFLEDLGTLTPIIVPSYEVEEAVIELTTGYNPYVIGGNGTTNIIVNKNNSISRLFIISNLITNSLNLGISEEINIISINVNGIEFYNTIDYTISGNVISFTSYLPYDSTIGNTIVRVMYSLVSSDSVDSALTANMIPLDTDGFHGNLDNTTTDVQKLADIVDILSGTGQVNSVVAGTGISINSTDPSNPIVTNILPDQTVSLTAGTNITSITGTYPSFTINASTQTPILTGVVLTDQTVGQTIGVTGARLTKLWVTDITVTNTITGSVSGNAGTVTNGVYTTSDATTLSTTSVGNYGKYLHSNISTGVLEWSTVTSAGATTALDNLSTVAINTVLIPVTAGSLDIGSTTKPWASIWFAGTSGTPTTNQFKLTGVSTSGIRTITVPDRDLILNDIRISTTTNGTGFIKGNGSVISFDNSTYLTTVPTGYLQNNVGIVGGTTLIGGTAQTEKLILKGNSATASGTNIAGGEMNLYATPGTGTGVSGLHFFTGTTLGTGSTLQTSSEKMTILGNGNVGIGTTSPNQMLHVENNQNATTELLVKNNISNTLARSTIFLESNSGALAFMERTSTAYTQIPAWQEAGVMGVSIGPWIISAYDATGNIRFQTGGVAAGNERMRIDSVGNVGIGTTTPTSLLHLKGGTATASTAPLKFTSGTNLTTAETGAMEYNGTNLMFTPTGTLRENIHTGGRGNVTLTVGTTTTVTDVTAKTTSTIIISPTSLAVIALTPYVSTKSNGSFIITTLISAGTETIDYIIIN